MKRILVIGIVLLLTFPLIKGGAKANALSNGAKVLYVGGSGPGNYSRIQDAINDANDGDTVFVYDDSSPYHESIVVNKSINLIGENKNTTIIDGSGYWNGIIISADRVNVSGFKIINFGYGYGQGAAISVRSSYCCIKDNIVMDNPGDGIQVFYGSCNLISNNDVINNRGEGINIYKSDKNLIDHNYIESNYRGVFVNEGHHNLVSN
ncbi:MAG: right-handed parallel beta-helix repeat-containing protein, partial [Thermoplasmata archaeon]|nr:right-handed parallel beta-helix repeat-containing protein [Thermoplasmata archaeon]